MRVLIIKTSSMGDIIHTLPALTDASRAIPGIQFDWLIEESFAEIPSWHPNVNQVIPVALRRWRKTIFSSNTWKEWYQCRKILQKENYDFIIDAQGLLKSVWLVWMAKGIRCGLNWESARESFASLFYQKKLASGKIKETHAIHRIRQLFSGALGYALPQTIPDYGIDRATLCKVSFTSHPYIVFLHGTTWETKHWPEENWIGLAKLVTENGFRIKLPWGNEIEHERAKRIALVSAEVEVLPRMKLKEIASVLAGAKAIVSVDTGLGHLAAALDVPNISLYGPTNPLLTGALGKSQIHLSADFPCAPCFSNYCTYREKAVKLSLKPPCFAALSSEKVWKALSTL